MSETLGYYPAGEYKQCCAVEVFHKDTQTFGQRLRNDARLYSRFTDAYRIAALILLSHEWPFS